jgi:hypothetical protein
MQGFQPEKEPDQRGNGASDPIKISCDEATWRRRWLYFGALLCHCRA